MKWLVGVLVPAGTRDIEAFVRERLDPLVSADPAGASGRFVSYAIGGGHDGEVLPNGSAGGAPMSVANNICPVADLAVELAALVTPDGLYHDVDDYGWRASQPPEEQERRLAAWRNHRDSTLARHRDHLAVGVCAYD